MTIAPAAIRARLTPELGKAGCFVVVTGLVSVPLWWFQPRLPEIAAAMPMASLAPLVGALVVWLRSDRSSLADWSQRIRATRGMIIRRTILALGAGLGVVLLLIQLRTLFKWSLMAFNMSLLPVPLIVIALITVVATAAQEAGWRGVLEPNLQTTLGQPVAVTLTGLAWALWSLPGFGVLGPGRVILLIIAMIALSILIDRLLRGLIAGRLMVATGFRWALAMGILCFGDEEAGVGPAVEILAAASVLGAIIAVIAPRIVRWAGGDGRDLLAG